MMMREPFLETSQLSTQPTDHSRFCVNQSNITINIAIICIHFLPQKYLKEIDHLVVFIGNWFGVTEFVSPVYIAAKCKILKVFSQF